MLPPSFVKYGFRIRTRHGLVIENLTIQGRDETDAARKLRQMYIHCEVLDCKAIASLGKSGQMRFGTPVSLVGK